MANTEFNETDFSKLYTEFMNNLMFKMYNFPIINKENLFKENDPVIYNGILYFITDVLNDRKLVGLNKIGFDKIKDKFFVSFNEVKHIKEGDTCLVELSESLKKITNNTYERFIIINKKSIPKTNDIYVSSFYNIAYKSPFLSTYNNIIVTPVFKSNYWKFTIENVEFYGNQTSENVIDIYEFNTDKYSFTWHRKVDNAVNKIMKNVESKYKERFKTNISYFTNEYFEKGFDKL
jgi:hypothetical protein